MDDLSRSLISEDDSSSVTFGSLSVDNDSRTPYSDATKCKKYVTHVKRPMNPFMVWSQIERRKLMEQQNPMHNAEVSVFLGHKWKQLSSEDRIPFVEESERLRKLHSQEFPDYKFKPKKRCENKISQQSQDSDISKSKPSVLPVKPDRPLLARSLGEAKFITSLKKTSRKRLNPESEDRSSVSSKPNVFILPKNESNTNDKNVFKPTKKKSRNIAEISIACDTLKLTVNKPVKKKRTSNLSYNQIWDSLQDTNITSLAIDKSISEDLFKTTDPDELSKHSNHMIKQPLTLPLHLDGCLTSGAIAALSCNRENWAESFDYLTDKVLQSSKNICDEIKSISKLYKSLIASESEVLEGAPPDLQIPDINKILGKNWKKPNYGLDFLK